MEKLTKAQNLVLKLIFVESVGEETALEKAKIAIKIYEGWFRQPLWKAEYELRMTRCQRRAEIILATFKVEAAGKLIKLTDSDKEGTARQACLDILQVETKKSEPVAEKEARQMKPATQEAILKIMADEKKGNDGT